MALQLDLKEIQKREIETADGKSLSVSYVGPIQLAFEDRICFVGAMVLGNECLLGSIPMEDMDLVINPKLRKVMANPNSRNMAKGLTK